MFNLSGSEVIFIAILGLIVLGPEKLPSAMRRAGKIYREIRNISGNMQREVQKAMAEPMAELKKTTETARSVFDGKMPHLEKAVKPPTPTPPIAPAVPPTGDPVSDPSGTTPDEPSTPEPGS